MSIKANLANKEIKSLPIDYPVKYSPLGTYIYDNTDKMIADVRGWGWIQQLSYAEDIQDGIGEYIVDAINEKIEREK